MRKQRTARGTLIFHSTGLVLNNGCLHNPAALRLKWTLQWTEQIWTRVFYSDILTRIHWSVTCILRSREVSVPRLQPRLHSHRYSSPENRHGYSGRNKYPHSFTLLMHRQKTKSSTDGCPTLAAYTVVLPLLVNSTSSRKLLQNDAQHH